MCVHVDFVVAVADVDDEAVVDSVPVRVRVRVRAYAYGMCAGMICACVDIRASRRLYSR